MLNSRWIFMTALFSFSALGGVSFEEKKNRVEFLSEITKSTSMNIEAYQRELNYEKLNLPLEKRAESEAQLLAEKVKLQISMAYEAAYERTQNAEEAGEEIRAGIERDLSLVAPELQDEMRKLSLDTLENVQRGEVNSNFSLVTFTKVLLKSVKERVAFLNEESNNELPVAMLTREFNKTSYATKKEILDSMTSDENIFFNLGSTSGNTVRTVDVRKADSRINLQVQIEFLGAAVEAGPSIAFRREYRTNGIVMSEGMAPALLPDGNFDFYTRDRAGKIVLKNGVPDRRTITFQCDADLEFETEYAGGGGFSIMGMGASGGVSKRFVNTVTMSSRRIPLPEIIDKKTMTFKYLNNLCHNDFLNAYITNNMTVKGALNAMMKNVVASLRFSHPKTTCSTDAHCGNWYKYEVLTLAKLKNKARCVEDPREKYMQCQLRGQEGQNCALFDGRGKRISSGAYEFVCDKGFKCQQYESGSFLKPAKGMCKPIKK